MFLFNPLELEHQEGVRREDGGGRWREEGGGRREEGGGRREEGGGRREEGEGRRGGVRKYIIKTLHN